MTKNMSLFKFAEDWSGENGVVRKVVWEEDSHYLADQAVELDLLFGVSPYYLSDSSVNSEDIVWNREEVLNEMIDYQLKRTKGEVNNDE